MQRHSQNASDTTSSAPTHLRHGSPFDELADRRHAEGNEASDMSFLVVDALQELGSPERKSAVAARIMDACCAKDDAACSVHITPRDSSGLDDAEAWASSSCCCQPRRQPSGCEPPECSDCYLEYRADGTLLVQQQQQQQLPCPVPLAGHI